MELEYESKRPLYIPYAGPILLEFPLLNKGSAFTEEERSHFNLHGLLPEAVETIEEQVERAYRQYQDFKNDNDKHIYLRNIQDTNETLFYRLLDSHLSEMMPIIYTPTVGEACEHFSDIYRRARGLFISYPNRDRIDDMLQNATKQNVKVMRAYADKQPADPKRRIIFRFRTSPIEIKGAERVVTKATVGGKTYDVYPGREHSLQPGG